MPTFTVSQAAAHELLPACRLLFNAPEEEESRERLLSSIGKSAVFVARAAGRVCGAALVQAMPGALGVTIPPRGESAEAVDAVTGGACAWLRERGVKVCQAFADADEIAAMAPLERAGFKHTTQLVFMRRGFSSHEPTVGEPTRELSFVANALPFVGEFADALLATHAATLDCPELNATRTPNEIVGGFESAAGGESYLVWRGNERVGVVMFEFGREADAAELTYLGVVPSQRGRNFGAELLKFVVTEVALARWAAVALSVDVRNAPAMKLYARHGFVEYERRDVWLATWPA